MQIFIYHRLDNGYINHRLDDSPCHLTQASCNNSVISGCSHKKAKNLYKDKERHKLLEINYFHSHCLGLKKYVHSLDRLFRHT